MKKLLFTTFCFIFFICNGNTQVISQIEWVQNYSERNQIVNIPPHEYTLKNL